MKKMSYTPTIDSISVHDPSATSSPIEGTSSSQVRRLLEKQSEHRDRLYLRKDILLQLYTLGPMNQTRLVTCCGLNISKHHDILEEMIQKDLLAISRSKWGNRSIAIYSISQKGIEILKMILEPYEDMFPRKKKLENHPSNLPMEIKSQEKLVENKNSKRTGQVQIVQARTIHRN